MSQSSKNTKNSSLTLFKHHFLGFVLEINNDQVARIQEINQNYADQKDIAEIVEACFRKPKEGEKPQVMNCTQMLEVITKEFPSVKKDISTKVHLGYAMKDLGFTHSERGHVKFYDVVPVKAA